MATFQPPPTYESPVRIDEKTKVSSFSPIWLNWFLNLVKNLNPSGAASVSSVSVVTANGVSGAVANPTTTPAITLALTNITPATVQPSSVAGYKSSDGSAGFTGTVTTASLVGKTITIKDGIITGFA